jgi:hypothetical protein
VSSATQNPGTTILNFFLCPSAFPNSRLASFATLYEKFCFRSFKVHYAADCSFSDSGTLLLAYDPDIADATPPATDDGIRSLLGMQASTTTQISKSCVLSVTRNDPQAFYYTNRDPLDADRLAYQGQIYVTVLSFCTNAFPGTVWIEYELDLFDPTNEPPEIETKFGGDGVQQPAGAGTAWNNLLTTYVKNSTATPGVGPTGQRGLFYTAGQYLLDQFMTNSPLGTVLQTPTLTAAVAANQPQATVTPLEIANPGIAGNAYRSDRISVPRGGAWAYGNVSVSTAPAFSRVRTIGVSSSFI